jgi:hypothetical protein
MNDKVYLLLEEHRFIKPRRFTIIAAYDSPESAMKDYKSYSKHITCDEYPYLIKLEEWEVKSNEFKN